MEYKDYYKILGVAHEASQDDIKRAYRKLARKYHPDVSKEKDAEDRFKEVQEAYEVLKDPEKRAAYDQLGQQGWQQGQDFRGPPPGWDAGYEFSGGFTDEDLGGFSDFFESLFGGGFRQARGGAGARGGFQAKGQDQHARIEVGIEDAYHGATRRLQLHKPEYDERGRLVERPQTLQVKIPKGITDGQRIRLPGQGSPGMGGGPAGDLYLEVQLAPHPLYRAEGRDLYVSLPVAPWEAALGAQVKVPTLGGTVDMKVPPGSQSGKRMRLRGRGLPGNPPGDEYVVLQVTAPEPKTDRARELYERMREEMPGNPREGMGV